MSPYGSNIYLSPTAMLLLKRLRRVLDTQTEEGCSLSDSELLGRGLASLLREAGASSHVNTAMVAGVEPEPC